MRTAELRSASLLAMCIASTGGCTGEAADAGPIECTPVIVDVEETCTSFCAKVVGECEAFINFDEERCAEGCEANLQEAYGCSDDCGTALEAMFLCVAQVEDCDDVYGWRDRTDDHACVDEVDDVGVVCPF